MWQRGFLILLAVIHCHAEVELDIIHKCRNTRPGDVIPNPLDCSSYFICTDDTKATINHCGRGLHFDAERKVCNWPNLANCKFGVTVFPVFPQTSTPNDHQPKPPTIDASENSKPDFGAWNDMRLTFAAFSVATGQIVNPMFGYDPQRIQCIHRGAYFLPHPTNCRRYFMCAFGHLLPHECGRGTVWSYKRQHCEIASDSTAECYATLFGDETTLTTAWTTGTGTITTATPEYTPTVCYPVYTTGTTVTWQPTGTWDPTGTTFNPTGTTWNPTGTTFNPTGTTWNPTGTTFNPTGTTWNPTGTTFNPTGTTWNPTGTTFNPTGTTWRPTTETTSGPIISFSTPTATPRTTATTTKKSDDSPLICSEGVKYLGDVKDCSHYFICIQEIPVGMFCPEGSFWDYQGEFCTIHAKVQCLSAVSSE